MTSTETPTVPRCSQDVLRNGYYTGRRCSHTAKFWIGEQAVCGLHKNQLTRRFGCPTPERITFGPADMCDHFTAGFGHIRTNIRGALPTAICKGCGTRFVANA